MQEVTLARSLRVLSINFPFRTQAVVNETALSTARALFDADVVVIRPEQLPVKAEGDWGLFEKLRTTFAKKRAELIRLLDGGGVLVVILDVVREIEYNTGRYSYGGGNVYNLSNYDFLDDRLFEAIGNGTGESLDANDPAEPFIRVLRRSKVHWTAYLQKRPAHPLGAIRTFAWSEGKACMIGAAVEISAGHIIFLPNLKELDETEFFEACREYRFGREGSPPPQWLSKVYLPGEASLDEKIAKAQDEVEIAEKSLQTALADRSILCAFKKLTYEKGKTHLEPIVRKVLDVLGFGTTPSEIIPGTNIEIDGRTTIGSTMGIVEIKGSRKQIALDDFSPLLNKLLADLQNSSKASKGILVGNGLCEDEPSSRLGESIFSAHVLDAARRSSVVLLNSVELYWLVTGVLSGEIKDIGSIRESILATNGYLDLRPYCGKDPFKS